MERLPLSMNLPQKTVGPQLMIGYRAASWNGWTEDESLMQLAGY